ncbi:MAG: acetate--CoA ligase family protein [Spirochaetota bacterium]|nr:acetate--CoA ligase family protein [Spirochaetota bacterium]
MGPLEKLINPSSIAIVGASNNPLKMATMHLLSIMKDGYTGKIFPVHPKEDVVFGLKAYKSPLDLPEAPDCAIFVIPATGIPSTLDAFGTIGTKRAIIISAGFKEVGEEGRKLEEEVKAIASKYGIRFLGPNCMGLINSEIALNTTVMAYTEKPGSLGFASQSGTYITQSIMYLKHHGIRFSKALSVGNEADISIIDALEYLGNDEQTRAISLYIEGIRDVPRFLEVASNITPKKPVIAQYVGGSTAGARAGSSHTGAMAGPDYLYEGLFKQAGIIRVYSVEELYMHGHVLATQPRLKGNRVGIITNSGGPGTSMANTCEKEGFTVPPFSRQLQEKIKPMIPPHAPAGNPVDITFNLDLDVLTIKIPELAIQSGEVDALCIHGAFRKGFIECIFPHVQQALHLDKPEDVLGFLPSDLDTPGTIPYKYGIPIVMSSFFDYQDDFTVAMQEKGVPVFDSPEKAAKALAVLLRYKEVTQRLPYEKVPLPDVNPQASSIIQKALKNKQKALDEHAAKTLLALYGIPIPDETLIESKKELSAIVDSLKYPVVMKACHPDIMHKTEKGLVILPVKDSNEAKVAFNEIQKRAGFATPVLVYTMVEGKREFMAGAIHQKGFGKAVLFGLGGIFTEALKDITFRVAPLTKRDAFEMIYDIHAKTLLGKFRNEEEVDTSSLANLLYILSTVPLLHPEISEIDCNPIIISGSKPVVIDALVVLNN